MPRLTPPPPARLDWAYFLDVDGTLIDLAATPDAVNVDRGLLALLIRLYRACGGALALVSGRSLADLDRRLAGLDLPMAGQHGFERRDAAGVLHLSELAPPPRAAVDAVLGPELARHPALLLEDKGHSLALHFRRAPALGKRAMRIMSRLAAELGDGYALRPGKCVVEMKPAGAEKGDAIAAYLAEPPFAGRRPVFIGDDVTDEHGFAAINRLGGLSIKVGPGPTHARHRLPRVAAVHAWLTGAMET